MRADGFLGVPADVIVVGDVDGDESGSEGVGGRLAAGQVAGAEENGVT